MAKRKRTKGQTTIYKYTHKTQITQWPKEKGQQDKQRSTNIHIKLKIEQHEPQ